MALTWLAFTTVFVFLYYGAFLCSYVGLFLRLFSSSTFAFLLLCVRFSRSLIATVLFAGFGIAEACLLKPEAAGMIFGEAQCCYKAKVRWTHELFQKHKSIWRPVLSCPDTDGGGSLRQAWMCLTHLCLFKKNKKHTHFGGKTSGFLCLRHCNKVKISE